MSNNQLVRDPVVYITSDLLIDPQVRSGSGGLGVVAGSIAAELENNFLRHQTPAIFVSTYATYGYQVQKVVGGVMEPTYVRDPFPSSTEDTGMRLTIVLAGRECQVAVRTPVRISQDHVKIYLLDTDIEENPEDFRMITRVLYGEGHATAFFSEDNRRWHNISWLRVLQAAVLGIGPVVLLEQLKVNPSIIHINDSHPVFGPIYLLGQKIAVGTDYETALKEVRKLVRFTNHTVLESGNKHYGIGEVLDVCGWYPGFDHGTLQRVCHHDRAFGMTTAALELAGPGHVNAVSRDHARIASEQFGHQMFPITNGVYTDFYQDRRFANLTDPADIPSLKREIKQVVLEKICLNAREAGWDAGQMHTDAWLDSVLIGIARRGQEYKRLGLMWHKDELPLVKTLLDWGWISVIWGGLVHPDDYDMTKDWNRYWRRMRNTPNVAGVFNYGMTLMRDVKAASQIWLNTPQYGFEACGTSWMSAMMNCSLPVSIGDGGVLEVEHVVKFGSTKRGVREEQYAKDAKALWQTLYPLVSKLKENDPQLLAFIYEGKLEAEEKFSATRMVDDYRRLLWK